MTTRLGLFTLLGLLTLSSAACSTTSNAPGEDDATTDEPTITAQKKCTPAAYNTALVRYKAAVEHSKAYLRGDLCHDGTMISDIANDLGAAVASCGDFKNVIKTSPWAAPARTVLTGNLALPALDGRLDAASLDGLSSSLVGITVWGPAPGAYGNTSKIAFRAGGDATLSVLGFDDQGMAVWRDAEARWSLGSARGGSLDLTLSVAGIVTVYTLKAEIVDAPYQHLPSFVLTPAASGDRFTSLPSECDA